MPSDDEDALQVSLICPEPGSVNARFPGAVGGFGGCTAEPYTSNSDSCPAGQPVFAVMVARTYRTVAAVNPMVTVFALAGSNSRPAGADRVVKFAPSVLPVRPRV